MRAGPGCIAGLLFALFVGSAWFGTIAFLWVAVSLLRREFGDGAAYVAFPLLGAVGWWVLFRKIEPWQERAAVRMFGSPGAPSVPNGTGGALALGHFRPWMKGWRRFGFLWAVAGPVMMLLLRRC